jgi:hypothetical protein
MSHCHAKSLLFVLLIVSGNTLLAQTSTAGSDPSNGKDNNPYSKYGIGELINGNSAVLRGMGNITSAYANPFKINTDNPASYASLQRTTFELGAVASKRSVRGTVSGTELTYKTGTATLGYMTFGVPVGKNAGLVLGFKPVTHVYYSLIDTIFTVSNPPSPIGTALRSYNGDGGLNKAFLGGGAKFKGLSIGFNAGFTFGTIRNTSVMVPIDTLSVNNAFNAEFSNYTRVGGINWKGGLQYEFKLDSSLSLRIGGTISTSQKLTQHYSGYTITYFNFGDTITRDTTYNVSENKGKLTLPLSYSVGVMLTKANKWGIGVDYTATQWSGFNNDLNSNMNYGIASSSYRFSAGGEFTPDAENNRKYLSRGTYRIGGYYGTDYLLLQNQSLPYYGITAGMSLPFRRSLSQVNAAIDIGTLGTTNNGLNKQNYIRFTLGITMNDLWFVKRKYE